MGEMKRMAVAEKEAEQRNKRIDEEYSDPINRELLKKMGYDTEVRVCKNCRYFNYGCCIYNAIHIPVKEEGQCDFYQTRKQE